MASFLSAARRALLPPFRLTLTHKVLVFAKVCAALSDSTGSIVMPLLFDMIVRESAYAESANTAFGVVESVAGVALMLTSLPIGWVADRFGRARTLKAGNAALLAYCATFLVLALEHAGTPDRCWSSWRSTPWWANSSWA